MSHPPTSWFLQRDKWLHRVSSVFSLIVFFVALWVLHNKILSLRHFDLLRSLHHMRLSSIFAALLLTVLDYFVLSTYDALGLRFVSHPLPYWKILLTSFLCYSFGHNLGFSLLSGGSIRYRLYTGFDVPMKKIANLIGFAGLTGVLGYLTIGSIVFLSQGFSIPVMMHLPIESARPVGILFSLLLAGFLFLNAKHAKPLHIFGWHVPHLPMDLCISQIAVSSLEILLSASVLFSLLPQKIPFPLFLGIYVLAQVFGQLSQVPGGIGVFESIILFLLPARVSGSDVIGALLAYRGIYYILPLVLGIIIFVIFECQKRLCCQARVRDIS